MTIILSIVLGEFIGMMIFAINLGISNAKINFLKKQYSKLDNDIAKRITVIWNNEGLQTNELNSIRSLVNSQNGKFGNFVLKNEFKKLLDNEKTSLIALVKNENEAHKKEIMTLFLKPKVAKKKGVKK